jgi:hypothetical protein
MVVINYKYWINLSLGERSQMVKATGCGSVIREFDSRRSPLNLYETDLQI